ncbi:GCN5 family acetyltransferase [Actinoplanes sp. SE50]|uniref:GNAT family N-acetyltransferase n=1 Tax=unclassified Actinoplanes TaxID=2626549 RepID=UPI00023EC095|nr:MULTISPECIES: GNAT family N-acetyltransferase [unclassified Actinoplanes]AEV83513.1 putative N-acetyltransferase [Actinoplanes sp. SE50/110]ATO82343.1 GCN5 family acetyltransferase [Actinoplanes sp. SE50]SLL99750.1 GCN5 family acetyltransferase [Actinoplanes sp. SE50/110]
MHPDVRVAQAGPVDLDTVTTLFLGYLDFYEAPADRAEARQFLSDRMTRGESTVLLARIGAQAAGFTQLYPSFSSVRRAPIWVLNDLFVDPAFRGRGVGRTLLRTAADLAEQNGVVRIELSTDESNSTAQALYESEGYRTGFPVRHYLRRIGA